MTFNNTHLLSDIDVILAKEVSKHYHKGQRYGDEGDYFNFHIQGVLETMLDFHDQELTKEHLILAYLHDVIEDTDCDIKYIYERFGTKVGALVEVITRDRNEDYDDYIESVILNPIALVVKYYDSLFNLQQSALSNNVKRIEKYSKNIALLSNHIVK